MTREMLVAVVVLGVGGCAAINDITGTSHDAGSATVTGQVLQGSGQPLELSSVVVDCGIGMTPVTAPTDSAGRYFTNLEAPAPGTRRCVFAVPDLTTPRIRVDTLIGFAPNGQLHALQFIDLREPAP